LMIALMSFIPLGSCREVPRTANARFVPGRPLPASRGRAVRYAPV
jgi:hypothetical protein